MAWPHLPIGFAREFDTNKAFRNLTKLDSLDALCAERLKAHRHPVHRNGLNLHNLDTDIDKRATRLATQVFEGGEWPQPKALPDRTEPRREVLSKDWRPAEYFREPVPDVSLVKVCGQVLFDPETDHADHFEEIWLATKFWQEIDHAWESMPGKEFSAAGRGMWWNQLVRWLHGVSPTFAWTIFQIGTAMNLHPERIKDTVIPTKLRIGR
jgi:hypothetical protein